MTHDDQNNISSKLSTLRELMRTQKLDGLLVPHGDEYQNEFVPAQNQRLKYLTGFTGSAGFAIILNSKAVVMSDGRYTIQLKNEIDHDQFEIGDSTKILISDWLKQNAAAGFVIGYDALLVTEQSITTIRKNLSDMGIILRPTPENLIDKIWHDRPLPQWGDIDVFPLQYAGLSFYDKIKNIQNIITDHKADAVFLTLPDSVSWCLNLRSHDVPHNPVLLSRLMIQNNKPSILFLDNGRDGKDIKNHLGTEIEIEPISNLPHYLTNSDIKTIMLDSARSPEYFFSLARSHNLEIFDLKDPTINLKACKNINEQNAMKSAHIHDAVAIISFLSWLDAHKDNDDLSELFLAQKLESFRKSSPLYRGSSFDTICGWNANGAIIHYRATENSFSKIPPHANGILLLDSGGQYEDGTTDITRTLSFGTVNPNVKHQATLVLKGMIAISHAQFPYGTTGMQIDVLARKALWDNGLDYAHGTGHGVGCYLSVHEEATSISPRSHDKMEPGMIVSNEPGYYKEGSHGIRIENLILCVPTNQSDELDRPILKFETLTLVPLDKNLIDTNILTPDEILWINEYHARIKKEISPFLMGKTLSWLETACTNLEITQDNPQ